MSFYSWLWRFLPGPVAVKVATLVIGVAAVVAALFIWAFPAIAPLMPFNETTVER